MQWTDRIKQVKIALIVAAVAICTASLIWSHFLVADLSKEEQRRMEVWAEAMHSFQHADENTDLSLVLKVIEGNNTIPVIVLDENGEVQTFRNLDLTAKNANDSIREIKQLAADMRQRGTFILVKNDDTPKAAFAEICYDESTMLKRLARYPYIQLGIVLVFVIVAIMAILNSKRAEQNKVWVGLSKETAHQLGTPISSLMAWVEVLKETYPDDEMLPEMNKDVQRLQMIAERFSKIGSFPEPQPENLNEVIGHVVDYIARRTSNHVNIVTRLPQQPLFANICAPLFEWVIENLCKNAVDAMEGRGEITIWAFDENGHIVLEVADSGKGIAKGHFKSVFEPGFTTKKRGWGLGLSLAKRIVEEYHKGRIFVKSSEAGKGTIFRIELK